MSVDHPSVVALVEVRPSQQGPRLQPTPLTVREACAHPTRSDPTRSLSHPQYYSTATSVYLVMQALSGGELYDSLQQQPGGVFVEEHASVLVRQMCAAVSYLHALGIVHRDLKLENFLFSNAGNRDLKLIDLGLSHRYDISEPSGLHSVVGTPYYVR